MATPTTAPPKPTQIALSSEPFSRLSAHGIRDECGAWTITGNHGTIHTWDDGKTWVLYVACRSALHWTYTKRRLSFCAAVLDCEGTLRLHQLPTAEQADVFRDVLGIRKKQEISDAMRERLKAFAFRGARATGRDFEPNSDQIMATLMPAKTYSRRLSQSS